MTLRERLSRSPAAVRFAPFVVFVLLTAAQGEFGPAAAYWIYLAKTIVAVAMIFALRPVIPEMRWAFSWEAVAVGIGIFAVWIGVSGEWTTQASLWPRLGLASAAKVLPPEWNPNAQFGAGSALAWLFIVVRILGSTFVVPLIEELFYRSFLYRYLAKHEFLAMPLNRFVLMPFLSTVAIFGLAHNEWLAAVVCGAAYQWLVLRHDRLGDAITAHAVTNFLLGVWVVWRGAWQFW